MLRRLLIYCETPAEWIRTSSLKVSDATAELSTWLMDPESVSNLVANLNVEAKREGVRVEAITHTKLTTVLANLSSDTMLWNVTDGCLPYHGSYVPAAAALLGIPYFGNPPFVQMLGQDKFKFYCFCAGLGVQSPRSVLVNEEGIKAGNPFKSRSYFIKPNSLGNSIGIGPDSVVSEFSLAVALARKLAKRLGHETLVQEFIEGSQYRCTYLNHAKEADPDTKLRMFWVDKGGPSGYIPHVPHGVPIFERYEPIEKANAPNVFADAWLLVEQVPLKDYGSFDILVDDQKNAYVTDINPCPFLDNGSAFQFSDENTIERLLWSAIKRSYQDQTKAFSVS